MDESRFKVPESVTNFGLVGERKAVALLSLGFFASIFALMAILAGLQGLPIVPLMTGLALCYGLSFFALAADWFWGRWFAMGLGQWGFAVAFWGMLQVGQLVPALVVFGVLHGLAFLCLLGPRMSARYEGRADWRERWQLDDNAVQKVQHAVKWVASALPLVIVFAFGPREPAEDAASLLVPVAALGLYGLLRGRTWGVLMVAAAGVATLIASLSAPLSASSLDPLGLPVVGIGVVGGALLLLAAAPFFPPIASYLRRR